MKAPHPQSTQFVENIAMHTNNQTTLYLKNLVLRPLQLLGLLPLSFDTKRKRFYRTRWNLLLTILQATCVSVIIPISYYLLLDMVIIKSTNLSYMLVTVEMFLNYILLTFSYAMILMNSNHIEHIFNSFIKVYFAICGKSSGIDIKLLKRYLRKVILVDYVLFPITFGMFIPFSIGFEPTYLISWIANSYSIMLMIMVSNLFHVTIILSSTLYQNINKKVIQAVQTLCHFDDNEPYWNRNAQQKSKICAKLSTEIDQLCYLHRMITRTVQRMTRILGVPLMLTILFQFFVVLTELYYNYILLMHGFRTQNYDLYGQTFSSLLFILMCFLQFYYSISFSAQMTKRAQTTAIFLNEFFLADVDQCVEMSIEIFTLEMLHHDYRVQMYDCFSMDFTLAYSAAATMTSYLIMLVQFGLVDTDG